MDKDSVSGVCEAVVDEHGRVVVPFVLNGMLGWREGDNLIFVTRGPDSVVVKKKD